MKNKILKYTLWCLGIGWLLFSVYYVSRDFVNKYQTNVVDTSYKKGIADSVKSLITEAKKCQPITAYNADDKVQLIWIDCLQELKLKDGLNSQPK